MCVHVCLRPVRVLEVVSSLSERKTFVRDGEAGKRIQDLVRNC